MSNLTKWSVYVLLAIAFVLAAISASLFTLGDAESAAYAMLWACFELILSCWVWIDSRIDL